MEQKQEQLKTEIMYQECSLFLIGSNNKQRREFLRSTAEAYPFNRKGEPIGVYVSDLGPLTSKRIGERRNKKIAIDISSSYLHSSIASRTLEVINNAPIRNFSKGDSRTLLKALKAYKFVGAGVVLEDLNSAIDYYRSNMVRSREAYEAYLQGEKVTQPCDVLKTSADLKNFFDVLTDELKLQSNFSVILDKRKPISTHSTRAINSLVGKPSDNFFVRVATSITEWKQFGKLEDGKDYLTILLDDSAPMYLMKKRK